MTSGVDSIVADEIRELKAENTQLKEKLKRFLEANGDQKRWFDSERVWWILGSIKEVEVAWGLVQWLRILSKKSADDRRAGKEYSHIPYDYDPYMITGQTMRLAILLNIYERKDRDRKVIEEMLEGHRKFITKEEKTLKYLEVIETDLKNFEQALNQGYVREPDFTLYEGGRAK